jgi:RNA polymerase sigma-70 factor (ECF subfamily)
MSDPDQSGADETDRLLDGLGAEDGATFSELFARHRPYLARVVALRMDRRVQARLDPSDVIQETQLEAFRRWEDYLARRPMPFRLWLRKTACEQLAMLHRRHLTAAQRSVQRESPPPETSLALVQPFLAREPSPSEQLGQRELSEKIRTAVDQLSESDREILLMRNLEQLSNAEVAQALGLTPSAASQRYGRALLRLRKVLIENGLSEGEP